MRMYVVYVLSAVWGAVIIWAVVTLLTMETSISFTALANAGGGVAVHFLVFILIAFCVWAIPSTILWLLVRKFGSRPDV